MRLLQKTKDGGIESTVDAYFLCEFKSLFSIALLKFNKGSRINYHNHAFNAWTWFICGDLEEHRLVDDEVVNRKYKRSFLPKPTTRDNMHKVIAKSPSWCFTIRGKWVDTWNEINVEDDTLIFLTHGRKVIKKLRNVIGESHHNSDKT